MRSALEASALDSADIRHAIRVELRDTALDAARMCECPGHDHLRIASRMITTLDARERLPRSRDAPHERPSLFRVRDSANDRGIEVARQGDFIAARQ